jgi:hypothetical protein
MQKVEKRNFTVLLLDVYYAMDSAKSGEAGMTAEALKSLLHKFMTITTAKHFTVIVFCSIQQQGPFLKVLRDQLNIAPENGIWHRTNAVLTNQHAHGFTSCAEGLVFGFHDATQSSPSATGTKAEWQRPIGEVQNVFTQPGVTSTKVSLRL